MSRPHPGGWNVDVMLLDSRRLSQVTFEGRQNFRPAWLGNDSLMFLSDREGNSDLWKKRWDGTGTAVRVLNNAVTLSEGLYSPDEAWLVYREGINEAADIYAQRLSDGEVVPLEADPDVQERTIDFSVNGRWLAFVSNRSGPEEVWVRSFPPDAGSDPEYVKVSGNGGVEPVFAHNGQELFYRTLDDELVAVQFTEDPTFRVLREDTLFSMAGYLPSNGRPMYDVSLNDSSFVMLRISDQAAATELIRVENWAEELRERTGN